MVRILIFDIDGTLLVSKLESEAYIKAFEHSLGITGINDEWYNYHSPTDLGIAREILCKHLGRHNVDGELNKVMEIYLSLLQDVIPNLIPSARQMLEILDKRDDIGLALATGNQERAVKIRLEKAGLLKYFRCGAFAEDGDTKVEILGKAIQRCREVWPDKNDISDVVYIGDWPSDLEASRSQGVKFIGINYRQRLTKMDTPNLCPDYLDQEIFLIKLEHLQDSEVYFGK